MADLKYVHDWLWLSMISLDSVFTFHISGTPSPYYPTDKPV